MIQVQQSCFPWDVKPFGPSVLSGLPGLADVWPRVGLARDPSLRATCSAKKALAVSERGLWGSGWCPRASPVSPEPPPGQRASGTHRQALGGHMTWVPGSLHWISSTTGRLCFGSNFGRWALCTYLHRASAPTQSFAPGLTCGSAGAGVGWGRGPRASRARPWAAGQ